MNEVYFQFILKISNLYKTSRYPKINDYNLTVAYYYTRICYILLHKRTHCHMLCFQNGRNRVFCKGFFFLLHWLLMLYKAKLNMYAHRISFSAARSRSTHVKGSVITVLASVYFPLLSSNSCFFTLSKIHYNGPRRM